MNTKRVLSTFLKRYRSERGMTQEDFAEFLKLPTSSYKAYEYEQRFPKPEMLDDISNRINIPVSEMLKESNKAFSDNKLVTSIEGLKNQLNSLLGKEDPNEVVNTWNEQIYTRATLARMQELDAAIIKFPTAKQADHLFVSIEEKKLWISSFWCFNDPWGTMRLLFFYSKYHASKHPENKGSNTFFFAEVPHWFQKQFPDHRQILNLDENTKPTQDKALA